MTLADLFKTCRKTQGLKVITREITGSQSPNLWCYESVITDYRNQDGSVGVTPKISVIVSHRSPEGGFEVACRGDVDLELAVGIHTVNAVAKIFRLVRA
jgi:hypothetical protein